MDFSPTAPWLFLAVFSLYLFCHRVCVSIWPNVFGDSFPFLSFPFCFFPFLSFPLLPSTLCIFVGCLLFLMCCL